MQYNEFHKCRDYKEGEVCDCNISNKKATEEEKKKISYCYEKYGMNYTSTKEIFKINWHIATDTYLEASGKDKNVSIETQFE